MLRSSHGISKYVTISTASVLLWLNVRSRFTRAHYLDWWIRDRVRVSVSVRVRAVRAVRDRVNVGLGVVSSQDRTATLNLP